MMKMKWNKVGKELEKIDIIRTKWRNMGHGYFKKDLKQKQATRRSELVVE